HPYTSALLNAVPEPDPHVELKDDLLTGEVADPSDLPSGCAFHPRCRFCEERCRHERPELRELSPNHVAACHLADR
ncbi:MAG: peptide ABC transporter ATP-binding protein, partial [Lentisphaerae bacterium]|nr:peptide ABC transporter ATP-binding protein [Lentisphaerota bacterium]